MRAKIKIWMWLILFLLFSACLSQTYTDTTPSQQTSPAPASTSIDSIFFPRQEDPGAERAVMEGEVKGTLTLENGCIRLYSINANTSYLLIWPHDFSITKRNNAYEIWNDKGESIAKIGDRVHVGGGEIPLLSLLPEFIQEQIPVRCVGPYWVIGDW